MSGLRSPQVSQCLTNEHSSPVEKKQERSKGRWIDDASTRAFGSIESRVAHEPANFFTRVDVRDKVDVSRLGMVGHSLGGQETLFATAIDTRIRAAVSSCGFGSLRTLKRDRINHNYALFVPGLANSGDYGAVLALIAPRPFFVVARTDDPIFPKDGIEETVAAARPAYAAHGAADRLATFYEAGAHTFSPMMRAAAYAWLDRWLAPAQ